MSTGLSVQEKTWKIDFKDSGNLGFQIRTILAIFDLHVTPMLPTKFQVNWSFGSGKEAKMIFSRWADKVPRFPIATILAIFDLHFTPMLPTKFQVNWHFSSGCFLLSFKSIDLLFQKKQKLYFQDSWQGAKISDRNHFSFFLIYTSPRCFLPSFKSTSISVQEKKQKIGFQDGCHCRNLGFPIGMILAIFDLQVTMMLPIQ